LQRTWKRFVVEIWAERLAEFYTFACCLPWYTYSSHGHSGFDNSAFAPPIWYIGDSTHTRPYRIVKKQKEKQQREV